MIRQLMNGGKGKFRSECESDKLRREVMGFLKVISLQLTCDVTINLLCFH